MVLWISVPPQVTFLSHIFRNIVRRSNCGEGVTKIVNALSVGKLGVQFTIVTWIALAKSIGCTLIKQFSYNSAVSSD